MSDPGSHSRAFELRSGPALITRDSLGRAAGMIESMCSLPSVPTRSWCDAAAEALLGMFASSVAGVLVCQASADGMIRRVQGFGLAATRELGRPGIEGGASARERTGTLVEEMRCGIATMTHLGWTPSVDPGVRAEARVMGPLSSADWNRNGPAQIFGPASPESMVVGVAPIDDPNQGRRLAVYVGPLGTVIPAAPSDADVLSACLPALARKAGRALAATWSDHRSWLSERERAVLERLIVGRSVPDIAAELGRSQHTVNDNVKALHRKLLTSNRGELIARALGMTEAKTRVHEAEALPAEPPSSA